MQTLPRFSQKQLSLSNNVSLPIPDTGLSLSRGYQTVAIMNLKIYCF